MVDFDRMRASDAERLAIVARLQEATAEGRLSLGEFSYRASRAYAARTYRELDRLVEDIPPKLKPQRAVGVRPPQLMELLPFVVLMLGVLAVPAAFLGSWGLLLGPLNILLGVVTMYRTPGDHRIVLAGTLLSLLSTVLLVILPVFFAG